MIMKPGLRKAALTAHVACSVGLLGAVAGFLALAVTGLTHADETMARAAYPAMALIARAVIVPLAFAALLTGLVQSLGTAWGLFRHYWVLVKLLLTALVTLVLLMQMESILYLARAASGPTLFSADLRSARVSLVIHAAAGLLTLLLPVILSLYKPRGLTRYGWRKRAEEAGVARAPLAVSPRSAQASIRDEHAQASAE